MKAIVNNNDRHLDKKKIKNNKQFKPKKDGGTLYPKTNNYDGKMQYFNSLREVTDSFTNNTRHIANTNASNSYKKSDYNKGQNNPYYNQDNFSSKPFFSNTQVINNYSTNKIDFISNTIKETNEPPSFVNSTFSLNNNQSNLNSLDIPNNLFTNLSNIDQLSNLDISNVNPHFSNTNPNYSKNDNNSSFKKKKYDNNFSNVTPFTDNKTSKIALMRKFDSKE